MYFIKKKFLSRQTMSKLYYSGKSIYHSKNNISESSKRWRCPTTSEVNITKHLIHLCKPCKCKNHVQEWQYFKK